jgi:hypothetical protein
MTAPKQPAAVLKVLHDHALFSREEIKAMPVEQLKALLAGDGMDIAKLTEKMKRQKELWLGAKQYQQACEESSAEVKSCAEEDLSSLTDEFIRASLQKYYPKLEELQMAARGFKGLGRAELESMYRDLIRNKKRHGKG